MKQNEKLKFIYITAFFFYVTHVKTMNLTSSNRASCVDTDPFCKSIVRFCDHHFQIRHNCPLSCGICQGPDPCSLNNGECSQFCSGETEPQCSCREGFQLGPDGRTCVDINECSRNVDPCNGERKVCVNTIGSYSCQLLNCESFGIGLKNYYKSNFCCNDTDFQTRRENENSQNASQWSWMAQLLKNDEYACGAALIGQNWIVTSAVCVLGAARDSLKIVLGDVRNAQYYSPKKFNRVERNISEFLLNCIPMGIPWDGMRWDGMGINCCDGMEWDRKICPMDKPVDFYNVFIMLREEHEMLIMLQNVKEFKIVVHPDSTNNDVALLQLSDEIHFNELIQPIQLPCGESPQEGTTCYVTGLFKASTSLSLMEHRMPVVPSFYCSMIYGASDTRFNSSSMMCAGDLLGGMGACVGDNGSPLVCQRSDSCGWYLSGVESSRGECGIPRFPEIFSKIIQVEDWIREQTGDGSVRNCSI